MTHNIWLRVKLPEKDLRALKQEFPDCVLRQADDDVIDDPWLAQIDGVFSEETVPEELLQRMKNLKWLHVTRGGVNAYLTPSVKTRPIQVTGSKGIHGTVFSEFALACIFAFAKKIPDAITAQQQKKWQKLAPVEVAGKTLGIVGVGTVGLELARKAKALGMSVLATKRNPGDKPEFVDQMGAPDFLPALMP